MPVLEREIGVFFDKSTKLHCGTLAPTSIAIEIGDITHNKSASVFFHLNHLEVGIEKGIMQDNLPYKI